MKSRRHNGTVRSNEPSQVANIIRGKNMHLRSWRRGYTYYFFSKQKQTKNLDVFVKISHYLYCITLVWMGWSFNAAVGLLPIDICDVERHNSNSPLQIRMQCRVAFHWSLGLTRPGRRNQIIRYFNCFEGIYWHYKLGIEGTFPHL